MGTPTAQQPPLGSPFPRRPATGPFLQVTIGLLVALSIALIASAHVAGAAGVDAGGPVWLDQFCVGQEQCAVGDFNGDGRDDVLTFVRDTQAGNGQGDVFVALSNGSSFQAPTKWHDFFCTGQEICKVGDFNGDGKDDIIAFERSGATGDAVGDVYVALSTGSGFGATQKWHDYFCVSIELCDVGDFNGDGRTDIISFTRSTYSGGAMGDVYVALSNGSSFGNGAKWQEFFCIGVEDCQVGDFNGDGKDDIIAFAKSSPGSPSGNVFVALSIGTSFAGGAKWNDFFCVGNEVCAVADFNGDNKDDIVTFLQSNYGGSADGDVFTALSSGSGFSNGSKWNDYFCLGGQICGVGDFSGDHHADIVAFVRDSQPAPQRGDVNVALSAGTPYQFVASGKWQSTFCYGQEQCATGDFNGDGKDDVLTFVRDTQGGGGQGDVWVALSNGAGFGPSLKWSDFFCVGQETCKVADVNGDGYDDLVSFVKNTQGGDVAGDVYVALSSGGSFGPRTKWHEIFCLGAELCDVGDFNGDGKADIITFLRSTYSGDAVGDVYVALSNGFSFGTATKWQNFFCISAEDCQVGDFNGDRRDDVVSFTKSGAVYVGLSNGFSFADGAKWNGFFCVGPETCGVGDFNGDGLEDVITFVRSSYNSPSDGDVYVGISNGISGFSVGPKWNDVFCINQEVCGAGDFNGDGRTDVSAFTRSIYSGDANGSVYVALSTGTGYRFTSWYRFYVPFVP